MLLLVVVMTTWQQRVLLQLPSFVSFTIVVVCSLLKLVKHLCITMHLPLMGFNLLLHKSLTQAKSLSLFNRPLEVPKAMLT